LRPRALELGLCHRWRRAENRASAAAVQAAQFQAFYGRVSGSLRQLSYLDDITYVKKISSRFALKAKAGSSILASVEFGVVSSLAMRPAWLQMRATMK
jgi:hypothetical protein